jgi:hypothetical protein
MQFDELLAMGSIQMTTATKEFINHKAKPFFFLNEPKMSGQGAGE